MYQVLLRPYGDMDMVGLRQSHAYSLLESRDLVRRLTVDRQPLPEIVNGQPSAVSGQVARRVTLHQP